MAIKSITYNNKVAVSTSSLPAVNQVQASDMNEIKTVVNSNASSMTRWIGAFNVPTSATWSGSSAVAGYGYQTTISLSGVTANDMVQIFPSQGTNDLGILSCVNDSVAGGVVIYANTKPTSVLYFECALVTSTV